MSKVNPAVRNILVASKPFIWVASVTIVLAFIVFYFIEKKFPIPSDSEVKAEYLEHYVDLVQVLTVGVAVTLISVIIPQMLPEARDKFERYKESRQAYSRAKTAVLYLADRVVNVDRNEAFQLVENAHRELHFAETFEDVLIKKQYLKWFGNPDLWISYNYWQITTVAKVLRKHKWTASENKKALKKDLDIMLKVVDAHFGKFGQYCKHVQLTGKKAFEDEVEYKIDQQLKNITD